MSDLEINQDLLRRLNAAARDNGRSLQAQLELWLEDDQRTTQQLAQSQLRLQALFDNALDCILLADDNGRYLDVNPSACSMLGYTREELLQMHIWEISGTSKEAYEREWAEFSHQRYMTGEYTLRRKDGKSVETEFTAVRDILPGVHLSVFRNNTERKAAENALRSSELRFRTLFNNAPVGILVVDEHGVIRQTNQQAERIFGYVASELVGEKIEMLVPMSARAQHDTYRNRFFQHPRSRPMGLDLEIFGLRKDGTQIPIEVALGYWNVEDENYVLTFVSDMTERRQAEEARRTAQLLQVELKKERELRELKSQFLTMVAHQFRTPLAVIMSSKGLVERYSNDPDKQVRHLEKIEAQVRRLEKMVEDVSIVSKNELLNHELKLSYYDLTKFIEKIISETMIAYPKAVEVILNAELECERVAFDGRLMDEILTNLITNAVKYTPDGGMVEVGCACEDDFVVVRVRDNGIGIPMKDQKQLFNPFFRARNIDNAPGSGLGLAIVKAAIEAYGGTIHFESAENQGTLFEVRLPRRIREDAALE